MKVDQYQPYEIFWTARQSSQVINWVKTKPRLAGNQISFRGTRFDLISCLNLGLVLTQLTTWDGELSKNFHGFHFQKYCLLKINKDLIFHATTSNKVCKMRINVSIITIELEESPS